MRLLQALLQVSLLRPYLLVFVAKTNKAIACLVSIQLYETV